MQPTDNGPGAVVRAEAGNAIAAERRTPNSIGSAYKPEAADDRPRLRLEALKAMRKGSLVGFATLRLPNGLVIADCPVCESHGKAWASIPGKPILDRDGRHAEQDGKKHYGQILQWADRDTADSWSDAVVDLVRQQHPAVLDREAV